MEQLDKKLHDSKKPIKPSDGLAENIMQKIRSLPTPKKRSIQWSRRTFIWASAPVLALCLVAISFFSLNLNTLGRTESNSKSHTPSNKNSINNPLDSNNSSSTKGSTTTQANGSQNTSSLTTLTTAINGSAANGTDDSDLEGALNNINGSLNENNQSMTAVDNAFNNQQLDNPTSD